MELACETPARTGGHPVRDRTMSWREVLFGRPLRTEEEQAEQIGPLAGVPVLGLDALASASYGPEAALTVLIPLGLLSAGYILPITLCMLGVLLAVYFSYRQTIAAYPQGGGSYTVVKENLGPLSSLLAASALTVDYVLNVALRSWRGWVRWFWRFRRCCPTRSRCAWQSWSCWRL